LAWPKSAGYITTGSRMDLEEFDSLVQLLDQQTSGENLTLGTLARPSWKRMNVEIELPLPGERLC
jgi:hypothetical protein